MTGRQRKDEVNAMWSREPGALYEEPDDYARNRRRLDNLRVAGWALIGSGGLLFVLELGIWWAYAGLLALAVAVGAGVYITVRAWRPLPHLRWWGAVPLAACALFLLGGPVAHLASAWVLIGLGLSLLAKTR
jgi:hypothetical protein